MNGLSQCFTMATYPGVGCGLECGVGCGLECGLNKDLLVEAGEGVEMGGGEGWMVGLASATAVLRVWCEDGLSSW